MSDLRDRLDKLVDAWGLLSVAGGIEVAEAAYKMALEDAAKACIAERVDAEDTGDPTDIAYNVATEHCAQSIYAAAEELK